MGRVFASSDWHGCWDPAYKVLEFLQPDDRLFFLGDAVDRGEDGIKVFQALISDPRVIFIKGNHEEMMSKSIPFVWKEIEDINYYGGTGYHEWYQNGGYETAKAFWHMTKEEVFDIKKAIDEMELIIGYHSPEGHDIILEHAGFSPFVKSPKIRKAHDSLWDRDHFYDEWNDGKAFMNLDPESTYLIHGHTPVQYLTFEYGYKGQGPKTKEELMIRKMWDSPEIIYKPQVIQYCDGHKFDIDMCTIASGRIALIDLDTFETIYFDAEGGM